MRQDVHPCVFHPFLLILPSVYAPYVHGSLQILKTVFSPPLYLISFWMNILIFFRMLRSPSQSWVLYSEHTLPVLQLQCSSQTIMWHFRPGCGCAQPRLREAVILFALDMLLHIESKLLSILLGNYVTSLTHTEWVIKWMPRILHVCFFQIPPNAFFLIGGWDFTFIANFFFISLDVLYPV